MHPATRFLKVNSQALWSAIAAILNLGVLFGWWAVDPAQLAGLNTAYVAVMMVLRQLFVLDTPPNDTPSDPPGFFE